MRTARRWTAALAAVAMAGCADGTGPDASDDALALDAALVAADAAIQDLDLMVLPGGPAGVGGPHGGGFSQGSFTGERTVTWYDVSGAEQERYDPLLTASVRIQMVMDGEATRPGWSGSIHRERDMTVSGLAGEETTRTWNGTGAGEVSRSRHSDEAGTRTWEMSETHTVTDVVRAVDRVAQPWPLSGTITHHVTAAVSGGPRGDATREVTVTITFDGTQYATLTVNGETYEVDLADRDGRRPMRPQRGHGQGG